MTKSEGLTPHIEDINKALTTYDEDGAIAIYEVELNCPYQMTVKLKAGTYRKIALIGEERFEIVGCYLGKRKKVIFKFKASHNEIFNDKISHAEMSAEEAYDKLDGFSESIKLILEKDIEGLIKKENEELKAIKEKEFVEANSEIYGNDFGSW